MTEIKFKLKIYKKNFYIHLCLPLVLQVQDPEPPVPVLVEGEDDEGRGGLHAHPHLGHRLLVAVVVAVGADLQLLAADPDVELLRHAVDDVHGAGQRAGPRAETAGQLIV